MEELLKDVKEYLPLVKNVAIINHIGNFNNRKNEQRDKIQR